jgi:hypothetical protein
LSSLDTSEILGIAGSISYVGKMGIGAGVSINKIYNTTRATISGSTLEHDGTLTLWGINDNEIISVAAGLAASKETLGASGMVSVNFIANTAEASISRSTNRVNPLHTNGRFPSGPRMILSSCLLPECGRGQENRGRRSCGL